MRTQRQVLRAARRVGLSRVRGSPRVPLSARSLPLLRRSSRLPRPFPGQRSRRPPLHPPHDRRCSHEPRLPLVHGEGRGLERGGRDSAGRGVGKAYDWWAGAGHRWVGGML